MGRLICSLLLPALLASLFVLLLTLRVPDLLLTDQTGCQQLVPQ